MLKFGLEEDKIEKIINIMKKYPEIESAKIFGSRARGDYRKGSDIDIAVFGKKITTTIHTNIFFEIEDLYLPYMIDLINFDSLDDKNKIKENILKEGIEIYVK